jgi:hypothetical protein
LITSEKFARTTRFDSGFHWWSILARACVCLTSKGFAPVTTSKPARFRTAASASLIVTRLLSRVSSLSKERK